MSENKTCPFEVGKKYYTRDKKSWLKVIDIDYSAPEHEQIIARTEQGYTCAKRINGQHYKDETEDYDIIPEEYIEPRPKVRRAQYLVEVSHENMPLLTNYFFRDDNEVSKFYGNVSKITRLMETEREFDE